MLSIELSRGGNDGKPVFREKFQSRSDSPAWVTVDFNFMVSALVQYE